MPKRQQVKPDNPQEREWYRSGRCRNCGKELDSARHYCDGNCNAEYWERHSWASIRLQVFRRDDFKCAHCGFQVQEAAGEGYYDSIYLPIVDPLHWAKQLEIDERLQRRTASNWVWDYKLEKRVFTKPPFVADHILPIALGGDEWDLNNLQTLCIFCNKVKTKGDSHEIAKARRVVYGNKLRKVRELSHKHSIVSISMVCGLLDIDYDEAVKLIRAIKRSLVSRHNPFESADWSSFWRFSLNSCSLLCFQTDNTETVLILNSLEGGGLV